MKKNNTGKTNYFYIALVIAIILIVICTILFCFPIEYNKYSAYGTLVSSITGLVISLFTLYLVFETFKSQKEELREAEITNKIQQFEHAFFQLLENHSRIIKSYDYIKTGNINSYFPDWSSNSKTGIELLDSLYSSLRLKFQLRLEAFTFRKFETMNQIDSWPRMDDAFYVEIVRFICKDIKTILQYINQQNIETFNKQFYIEVLLNTLYDSEKFLFSSFNHLNNSVYFATLTDFHPHYKTQLRSDNIDLLHSESFLKISFDRHDTNDRYRKTLDFKFLDELSGLALNIEFKAKEDTISEARFSLNEFSHSGLLKIELAPNSGLPYYKMDLSQFLRINPSIDLEVNRNYDLQINFQIFRNSYTYQFSLTITFNITSVSNGKMYLSLKN